MIYYVIALISIALDQWTKWLIVKNMQIGDSVTVIQNFFYITSHRNRGAAWGILQGQMWFFYVITIIVVGFVVFYIYKEGKKQPLLGVALGLILGGALGNFIDRLFRKEVVDFVDVYLFSYDYPIFNLADSSLVVGVGLVLLQTLLDSKQVKENTNGKT